MTRPEGPLVVGIAGPSGSGKTSLARALVERAGSGAITVCLDSYYKDQRGVPEDLIDVDIPEALDYPLLISNLRALVGGRAIQQPIYDYATHARAPIGRTVAAGSFIVVEGLYALYWPELRSLFSSSVFVVLDHAECLKRRIARDAEERGRTQTTVRLLYEQKVRPMYDRHIHPTRAHADVILDGRLPLETLIVQVQETLPR